MAYIDRRPRYTRVDLNANIHGNKQNLTADGGLIANFTCPEIRLQLHQRVPPECAHDSLQRFVAFDDPDGLPFKQEERLCSTPRCSALTNSWQRLLAHTSGGMIVLTLREACQRRREILNELHVAGLLPRFAQRMYWYIADRPRKQNGTYGCYRSHVCAVKYAKERGWQRYIVAEDDLYVLRNLRAGAVHDVADVLDANPLIPVVTMSACVPTLNLGKFSDTHNIHPIQFNVTTTFLVCTPYYTDHILKHAQQLVDREEPRSLDEMKLKAIDNHLFVQKRLRNTHAAMPASFGQRQNGSYISYKGVLSVLSKIVDAMKLYQLGDVTHFYRQRLLFVLCIVLTLLLVTATTWSIIAGIRLKDKKQQLT